jgi:hypothetical protein
MIFLFYRSLISVSDKYFYLFNVHFLFWNINFTGKILLSLLKLQVLFVIVLNLPYAWCN